MLTKVNRREALQTVAALGVGCALPSLLPAQLKYSQYEPLESFEGHFSIKIPQSVIRDRNRGAFEKIISDMEHQIYLETGKKMLYMESGIKNLITEMFDGQFRNVGIAAIRENPVLYFLWDHLYHGETNIRRYLNNTYAPSDESRLAAKKEHNKAMALYRAGAKS
jgi:hypothetical protein